jgi:hypothetical protein
MKENSIYETISFELSKRNLKDLENDISSTISYDFSLSFENQLTEFGCINYSREEIKRERLKRNKIPNELT